MSKKTFYLKTDLLKPFFFCCLITALLYPFKGISQASSEIGLPLITNYTTKVYKGHPQVWAIAQDKEGILYFGTTTNITEYDGVNWKQIKITNSLGIVRALLRGSDGNIYYGSANDFGFLKRDSYGNTQAISLMNLVAKEYRDFNEIASIVEIGDHLYFQAREFIFRLDIKTGKPDRGIEVWKPETLFSRGFNLYGSYYVQQQDKGLYQLMDGAFVMVPGSEILGKGRGFSVLPYREGVKGEKQFLIGMFNSAMYRFDGKEFYPFKTQVDKLLISSRLIRSLQMENGNYVLSLLGHGIKVIDLEGKLLHSINFDAGLQDESVYAMYLDQSGLLWLGLDNGIAKVELNSQLSTFSKQMGLKTAVLSIARVNHTLYLGTATGLYFFDKAKRTFELLPKIAPIQIFDLVKDGEDLLIPGEGLNVLRTTTGEIFQVGKEFNYFITLKLSTQFPDILYMGGNSGITVFRRNRNKSGPPWLAEGNFLGITKDIYTLTESKEGDIWAGTQSGIVYKITPVRNSNGAINFQSSKTEIFGQENGLINAVGIVFGVNGKVYVPVASEFLTYDASTKRLVSDPTFGKITVDVFEVENFFLKDDSSGRVWMPLGNKIRLATPLPEGGYKLEDELFNAYPLKGIYSILPEGDGIVWIGSEEGLVRFDENVKARPNRSFKALLRQITSGKDSLSHINSERKTKLDNKNNSLRFTYAAPFYNQEERTLYQTLLDGFDEDWSKWDRNSYKEYTNLSSGTYTFRVRAKNLYNTISQEATYTFAILPPWYGTWWAITLFAWLFIGLIWVVFYYRSRQLRKENRILEHKVSIRTAEVLQQKEEILAQRDNLENTLNTLKSTQNQLIQAEKMASLGELTTGIAHEIQNPLNFINNFSEVNKELIEELEGEMDKGNTDEVKLIINDIKENEQKVLLHGKRADAIVKSMLQHSRTSSGERQATDINVLADEYLRLAYHGLRAKDKEFNVKLLTDFDEHLPKTEVVPQEIGRVFLNLFNNAFYATIQKKLHLNGQYQPQVKITTKAIENKLEIRVTDNGTGIPENVKNKIFQPFFTTKPTGEGTGLGLSLSYDIITKGHSGELQVQSKEGEFTELIISLPLR